MGQPRKDPFVQSMNIAGSQEEICLFCQFPVEQERRPVPRKNINNELVYSTDVKTGLGCHDNQNITNFFSSLSLTTRTICFLADRIAI